MEVAFTALTERLRAVWDRAKGQEYQPGTPENMKDHPDLWDAYVKAGWPAFFNTLEGGLNDEGNLFFIARPLAFDHTIWSGKREIKRKLAIKVKYRRFVNEQDKKQENFLGDITQFLDQDEDSLLIIGNPENGDTPFSAFHRCGLRVHESITNRMDFSKPGEISEIFAAWIRDRSEHWFYNSTKSEEEPAFYLPPNKSSILAMNAFSRLLDERILNVPEPF